MAFLWKKKEKAVEERAEGAVSADDVLLKALLGSGEMTKEKMLEIPTVAGCVQKLAGTVAKLPIRLYHRLPDGKVEEVKEDERLLLLNEATGDALNTNEFWKNMIEDYYLGKGGFAYIRKEFGGFAGLHHVAEEHISVLVGTDPIFKAYRIQVNGMTYLPHEFLKIRRRCRDGASGKSLYEEKPLIFATAYATMQFEKMQVQKGGNKRGFIEAEKRLSEGAMTAIKEAWKNLYSTDSDRVVILNDGAKFKESSNTSVEMQLYENKEANSSEICKIFGFSQKILAGGATEADRKEYLEAVVELLNTIETALDTDLLLETEKGSFYFAFDTRELTRGNIKERYEAYEIGLKNNFLQIDEVREREDWEPLGINFLRLGLDSVLVDMKTKKIYTPNTNEVQDMNFLGGGEKRED